MLSAPQLPYALGVPLYINVIHRAEVANAPFPFIQPVFHEEYMELPNPIPQPEAPVSTVFPIKVNGKHLFALLDTGASISLIKADVSSKWQWNHQVWSRPQESQDIPAIFWESQDTKSRLAKENSFGNQCILWIPHPMML